MLSVFLIKFIFKVNFHCAIWTLLCSKWSIHKHVPLSPPCGHQSTSSWIATVIYWQLLTVNQWQTLLAHAIFIWDIASESVLFECRQAHGFSSHRLYLSVIANMVLSLWHNLKFKMEKLKTTSWPQTLTGLLIQTQTLDGIYVITVFRSVYMQRFINTGVKQC